MIIRIPLDDTNSRVSYRYSNVGDISQSSPAIDPESQPSADYRNLTVRLEQSEVPALVSSHYNYPVTDISVTVPDDDKPVVAGWFGNSSGGSTTPSETLVKRLTTAVIGKINSFYDDASRIGLFTRPFRLGYALLTADSKLIASCPSRLVTPNDRAPVMAIRDAKPAGDRLETLTEIRNFPYELRVSLPPFTIPDELRSKVVALVFYVTGQTTPLTGEEQVTGVRSFVVESGNCPGWYYPRLSAEVVADKALNDSKFRIIGRVPIVTALSGLDQYRLPDSQLDLTDFKSYPEAKDVPDADDPVLPGNPPDDPGTITRPDPTGMIVTTYALDLGRPEENKRVRGVSARGIFSRHPDNVQITLYGAHHLPADQSGLPAAQLLKLSDAGTWKKIARARGPHIRLLRGVRYRWIKVEISAPWPSRIDALTFTI